MVLRLFLPLGQLEAEVEAGFQVLLLPVHPPHIPHYLRAGAGREQLSTTMLYPYPMLLLTEVPSQRGAGAALGFPCPRVPLPWEQQQQ